jgi:small subunit ribosomal protein S2
MRRRPGAWIGVKEEAMAVVTMRQLLESGVHFGHQTRRWNPKMKRFIMTERNGIYIIDLQQSLAYIDRGYAFIKGAVASGGNVLFVGTKKQAQEAISEQAKRVGMPFVNQRWLGGMLTNFQTVHQRILRLKELEEVDFDDVAGSSRTKKELLQMRREKDKLDRTLGGIRDMGRVPAAVWIVDTNKEHLAVDEARKLGIPIVAILDSNCDPDMVDFPIPGNDDAIRSVTLLTRIVADAVADGLMARAGVKSGDEATGEELGAEEPLAEWERELLGRQAEEVAAQAAAVSAANPAAPAAETPPVDPALTPPPAEAAAITPETQAAATPPETQAAATPAADAALATSGAAGAPADTTEAGDGAAAPAPEEPATAGGEPVADDSDQGSSGIGTTGGEPVPAPVAEDSADRA